MLISMKAFHFKATETSPNGVHSAAEVYETKMSPKPERNESALLLNRICTQMSIIIIMYFCRYI